ncbi:PREDICTED: uncharacterized protein LOC106820897 isoform X2 [Priapulus caudatus]|uniref:Uncharacterized protein LOC106820897 isoform X2 n=1 Tax=Priapulus caudatus TaxID=37621 RepID=A0ABM1F959_PRICU|nr:PREDICTED: uncharacterized protein LOC106820897 isoform X2 [Priapulus caudatus]
MHLCSGNIFNKHLDLSSDVWTNALARRRDGCVLSSIESHTESEAESNQNRSGQRQLPKRRRESPKKYTNMEWGRMEESDMSEHEEETQPFVMRRSPRKGKTPSNRRQSPTQGASNFLDSQKSPMRSPNLPNPPRRTEIITPVSFSTSSVRKQHNVNMPRSSGQLSAQFSSPSASDSVCRELGVGFRQPSHEIERGSTSITMDAATVARFFTYFEDMKRELAYLKKMVTQVHVAQNRTDDDHSDVEEQMFPLNDNDQLMALERELNDRKMRKKVLKFLCSIGGHNLGDALTRILNALMKPAISCNYTLHGKGKKKSFKALKLYSIICIYFLLLQRPSAKPNSSRVLL